MKTYGKARIIFPDLVAIKGKLYKLTVKPIHLDFIGQPKGTEQQIVLEEIESEDEP